MFCFRQEIGLEDYMNQLDHDHDDYVKDNQVLFLWSKEKNKFKSKHISEEDMNRMVLEQNQMFEKLALEKGTSSKANFVTLGNIGDPHQTEDQKKQQMLIQNLKKDENEDFESF